MDYNIFFHASGVEHNFDFELNFVQASGLDCTTLEDREVYIKKFLLLSGLNYAFCKKFVCEFFFHSRSDMKLEKIVRGNFNQADEMFSENAGKQSATIALFSICWTKVRRISIWKSFDLDFILHKGDAIFKGIDVNRSLHAKELPEQIFVEANCFNIRVIKQIDVKQPSDLDKVSTGFFIDIKMLSNDNVNGALIFADELCVTILKNKCSFFIFNSHSHDPDGKIVETCIGQSILIEFSNIKDVCEYIFTTYDFISYQLAYIEVKAPENTNALENSLVKFKKTKLYRQCLDNYESKKVEDNMKKSRKRHYEKFSDDIKKKSAKYHTDHSDGIKMKKAKYYTLHSNSIKKSNKKYKEDHPDKIKRNNKKYYKKSKENNDRDKRILNFHNTIKEGPVFFPVASCVVSESKIVV